MQLRSLAFLPLAVLVTSSPIPESANRKALVTRQVIRLPGVNVTNPNVVSDVELIGEAFLEGDSDSGGEDDGRGDANSVANGYPGNSVGVGSSSFNANGSTSGSSACTLFACTSETSAQNANGTSSAVVSSGLINNGPMTINFNDTFVVSIGDTSYRPRKVRK